MTATGCSPTRCGARRRASAAEIVDEKRVQGHRPARAHRFRRRADPAADAGLHAGPARPRRRAGRRRERGVRHLRALPHLDPAAGRRHGRAGARRAGIRRSEQWGGTQIQNRFAKATGRRMLSKDMPAWTAVRIVGEAATRTQSGDPAEDRGLHPRRRFSIAAFKGQKLTFRNWNWQLRQPIFLGDGRIGRLGLAAGGIPAPGLRARHARRRPAGDQVRV